MPRKKGDKASKGGSQRHPEAPTEPLDEILEKRIWNAADMKMLRELIPGRIQEGKEAGKKIQELQDELQEIKGGGNLMNPKMEQGVEDELALSKNSINFEGPIRKVDTTSPIDRETERSLLQELERAKQDATEKDRRIKEVTSQVEDMKKHRDKQDMDRKEKERRIKELEGVKEDAIEKDRRIKELERVKEDATENERRIKELADQVEDMKTYREKKDVDIENLQAEAKKAREIKGQLERQVKSDEKEKLEETMKELQETNRALRNDLDNTGWDDLTSQLVNSGQLAQRLRDERDNLFRDAQSIRCRISEMESEIDDLKRKVSERDKLIHASEVEIRTLDEKLQDQFKQEDKSKASIRKLQKQLSDLAKLERKPKAESLDPEDKAEIRKLQRQLQVPAKLLEQKVKEEIPKLQQEAKDQEELLAASKMETQDRQREAEEQKMIVEACKRDAQDLQREVDEQKNLAVASKSEAQRLQREVDEEKQQVQEQKKLAEAQKRLLAVSEMEIQRVKREAEEQKKLADEQKELVAVSKIGAQGLQRDADEQRELVAASKREATEREYQLRELSGGETERLRQQLEDQRKEAETFKRQADKMRSEGNKHAQRTKELEMEVQTQLKLKENSARLCNEEKKQLLNTIRDKNVDMQILKSAIQEQGADIKKFDQRRETDMRKNEIEVEEKETRLKEQEDICRQLQKEIDRYQGEIEDLKERLEKSNELVKKQGDAIASQLLEENTKLDQQNRALEQQVSTQEGKVMRAQEAAMGMVKTKEALRYKFLPDSVIRSEMYASLEVRPDEWARKYAARRFDPSTATRASLELRREFEKVGGKRSLDLISRASPHIALLVLLVHYITEHVLKQPFLRLGVAVDDDFAADMQTLYEGFQKADEKADEKAASVWRSETLELLSRQWVRSLDESQGTEWSRPRARARAAEGVDEFPFPAGEDLAGRFIDGPAAVFLEPSMDTNERRANLADVIRQAAWVAFMLWRQRAQLDIGGYDEWKEVKYSAPPVDSKSVDGHWSQLRPKNFLRSGAEVGIIIQPSITASWIEDGEEKRKVWRAAVALWRNCAFNNDVEVSEEYEDDSDEYPDLPL